LARFDHHAQEQASAQPMSNQANKRKPLIRSDLLVFYRLGTGTALGAKKIPDTRCNLGVAACVAADNCENNHEV
jgi:hypothetical protein